MKKVRFLIIVSTIFILMSACEPTEQCMENKQTVLSSKIKQVKTESAVTVKFPAYQDGKTEQNCVIYDTEPFEVTLDLPIQWEISIPMEDERKPGLLFTPMEIVCENERMGTIGFYTYTPYEEDDIPEEDYYKTVYSNLRLGSQCFWDPYTPIKTTDTKETGIATVNYLDPAEIENHPGAMADVPWIEVPGILAYDNEKFVYIGIQFEENAVTDDQVNAIAQSIIFK